MKLFKKVLFTLVLLFGISCITQAQMDYDFSKRRVSFESYNHSLGKDGITFYIETLSGYLTDEKVDVVVYFYHEFTGWSQPAPLKDTNNKYAVNSIVATYASFTPLTYFHRQKLQLSMPYSELHLPTGKEYEINYTIRAYVHGKEIGSTIGFSSFKFNNGAPKKQTISEPYKYGQYGFYDLYRQKTGYLNETDQDGIHGKVIFASAYNDDILINVSNNKFVVGGVTGSAFARFILKSNWHVKSVNAPFPAFSLSIGTSDKWLALPERNTTNTVEARMLGGEELKVHSNDLPALWMFMPAGEAFIIANLFNPDMVLEVDPNRTSAGAPLRIARFNGGRNQKWYAYTPESEHHWSKEIEKGHPNADLGEGVIEAPANTVDKQRRIFSDGFYQLSIGNQTSSLSVNNYQTAPAMKSTSSRDAVIKLIWDENMHSYRIISYDGTNAIQGNSIFPDDNSPIINGNLSDKVEQRWLFFEDQIIEGLTRYRIANLANPYLFLSSRDEKLTLQQNYNSYYSQVWYINKAQETTRQPAKASEQNNQRRPIPKMPIQKAESNGTTKRTVIR